MRIHRICETPRIIERYIIRQIGTCDINPCGNHYKCQNTSSRVKVSEMRHSIKVEVKTFVAILTPPRCSNDKRRVVVADACKRGCNLQHALSCDGSCVTKFRPLGDESGLKAVRGNNIRTTAEQLLTFACSDFTDCRETIGLMCGCFFKRMFRLHI